ncbi:hypothetical protein Syun_011399 [Stephania yunnanensis]|uniref:Uncharacterized protein n=1 Tax=Stephania yunnanensis TaxID=152371 RepID=A0AAP0PGF5_9MAGN
MAARDSKPYVQYFYFLYLSVFVVLQCVLLCESGYNMEGRAETNGMFVFGSSLVDNGNNNFVNGSVAKADYFPYGIDFPLGPSGRFCNGKNMIDALGEQLKLPHFVPVFTDPMTKGKRLVHGVNYASGGSGILDDTGSVSGRVITLNQQIRNFEEVTQPDLETLLGCKGTELLSNYLFVVGAGGNDYLLNYFLSGASKTLPIQDFTANLTATLSNQLKKLHSLGARKFVLISIYPMGYTPIVKAMCSSASEGCTAMMNQAALLFNSRLKALVDEIKPQMPGSNIVYINTYQIINDIISDPASRGFTDTINPCCEVGANGILCKREGSACLNRNSHVFFDGLHPTEAVNVVMMERAYASNLTAEAYPFNVKTLASLSTHL